MDEFFRAGGRGAELADDDSGGVIGEHGCFDERRAGGERGMMLLEDGEPTYVPTAAREVYDVTGAGDTVIATLALMLAAGASLTEAAVLANHAAGIVVGKLGTATAGADELINSLEGSG